MLSDDLARPYRSSGFGLIDPKPYAPWSIEAEYVWIDCDLDVDFKGLAVEVQKNLSNRQRKALRVRMDEIADEARLIRERFETVQADLATDMDAAQTAGDVTAQVAVIRRQEALLAEREQAYDANERRLQETLAPFIRAWNVSERASDGAYVDTPAPQIGGADAFDGINREALGWIRDTLMLSYRWGLGFRGKGQSSSPPTPEGSDAPTNGSDAPTPTELPADSPLVPSRRSRRKSATASTSGLTA